MPQINTFVFLDLEATGLGGVGEKPRITEISLVAINKLHLLDGQDQPAKIPRVLDKLSLCVYPMKPVTPDAAAITGLYNDSLLHKKDFDTDLAKMLNMFLARQESPTCLVAHNGNGYDYGLLQAEFNAIGMELPESIYCIDSLEMLRDLDEKANDDRSLQDAIEMKQNNQETPMKFSTCQVYSEGGTIQDVNGNERLKSVKRKLFQDDNDLPTEAKVRRSLQFDEPTVTESPRSSQEISNTPITITSSQSSTSSILCNLETEEQSPEKSLKLPFDSQKTIEYHVGSSSLDSRGNLMKDLTCNEVISEDSSSDPESSKAKTPLTMWPTQESLGDDVLLDMDLEGAVQRYYESEQSSSDVSNDAKVESEKTTAKLDQVEQPTSKHDFDGSNLSVEESQAKSIIDGKKALAAEKLKLALQKAASLPVSNVTQTASTIQGHDVTPSTSARGDVTPVCPETSLPPSPTDVLTSNPKSEPAVTTTTSYTSVSVSKPRPRLSYKLEEIHRRMFGHLPRGSHRAEDDSLTLLRICQSRASEVCTWADEKAVLVADVPPMYEATRTPLKDSVLPHHL